MTNSDGVESSTVHRRKASSRRTSYADPVILHETTRTRITLVPFFIPRSHGTDLSVKIQSYKKAASDWLLIEEKSVSLQEAAARKLHAALSTNLQVAQEDEDGQFLVIRLDGQESSLEEHDPGQVAGALARALGQKEIAKHLQGADLSVELLEALRSAVRLSEMRSAVAALRAHLEQGDVREQVYQDWCNAHAWAFGNAYVATDSIRQISAGDQLDLLLSRVISGFRDIVELKRPDMSVLQYDKSHRSYYFSADVSKAIGQCHRYLDVLHRYAEKGLDDNPEIVAYHPRAIVVVGRSDTWSEEQQRALHGLNSRLSDMAVMTYDQLLAQGERLVALLTRDEEAGDMTAAVDPFESEDDDDIPF